ncbi:ABC transporter ATP-binding protein [Komagataeibacter intermedius]|uniref:Nitrate ABC transporter ATPase n=2 Tax=Komagataeibacter intermedius TaxID=66229 RepID=A0A0N0MFD1_9PROT|nr:ABC transporter ATP-binding protein [Komagataeibacter intermedius]KPH87423.1 nitrate ABC transporter ATPase [Komagataeibacter intermedius AF2]MCF3636511.1 ABC transporter ATP-binding protein [Komagataeibacter intermedius]GAN85548.1 ABC transporter nitrate permease [Komagataeibacter intermedius TF2]GBQ65682.1 nitrate/sulfonate/bicarbonate transporter ATP-binding protein [Komagataeibacter intermedius NRIC 0521]
MPNDSAYAAPAATHAASRPLVEVSMLEKRYGDSGPPVFSDVSFTIQPGEFVCLIGHSGCGKSSILNILAGLEQPSGGTVIMDGHEITRPGLERGVVFQGHALLPWLSAVQNVAFAVRSRFPTLSRAEIREKAEYYLHLVGLRSALDKKPAELSGGMRQRVGIARAFSTQPRMLLMDEPFGALDALTRGLIQEELLQICARTQQTVFMITHDVDEAILLADRVLLMSNGPDARLAESIDNPLPRTRTRESMHHETGFYDLRNHLVDFLVRRSALVSKGEH